MSPAWSLQQSVFAALAADAALTALIGPGRIFDDVPQGAALPYATLGPATTRDWSTGSEQGTEHAFTVHVWSGAKGKKQAHEALDAIRAALHDQPLTLVGQRLVSLHHERSDVRLDPDGETVHGSARFRALTEP